MKRILPAVVLMFASLTVFAQEAAGEAATEVTTVSMKQIITQGGPLMYPIIVLSFLAVCLIVFYLLTMRKNLLFPKKFLDSADELIEAGDLEGLQQLCASDGSPAAQIVLAALSQCSEGKIDQVALREAMEEEGSSQAGLLWQRIQYLMDISVVAPMVGLLGTVWGMMVSFSGMESGVNFANKAATLASGVSQAMFTTFGGLIVGILSMVFYSLFRGRVNRLVNELESKCGTIVRKLSARVAER